MRNDFKGMNPELAKAAMGLIQSKKTALDSASKTATTNINVAITGAFAGTQATAMEGFVTDINNALENLYKCLDGADSNFASKFAEVIKSYEVSDANVASSYSSSVQ